MLVVRLRGTEKFTEVASLDSVRAVVEDREH